AFNIPKPVGIAIVITVALIGAYLFLQPPAAPIEKGELDSFAQCLSNNGLVMYGSEFCSYCAKQKDLFGTSFHHLQEVECHPRGTNPQTELCLHKDIMKTPTWILEDTQGNTLEKLEGYQALEDLAEFTGCTLTTT
ncbi:MAG: hypothetical protein GOV15_01870, partial [Candidatus Diapherotrites archaeon]|nr:hypothetical protein [Candidatus Diapherotrites archaeon]